MAETDDAEKMNPLVSKVHGKETRWGAEFAASISPGLSLPGVNAVRLPRSPFKECVVRDPERH